MKVWLISLTLAAFIFIACDSAIALKSEKTVVSNDNSNTILISPSAEPTLVPITRGGLADEPIVEVDFYNFTYPWCSNTNKPNRPDLTMVNGRVRTSGKNRLVGIESVDYSIDNVYYHDFTSDGRADALVTLASISDSRQTGACSYLITVRSDRPVIIWNYFHGDRSGRMLRKIDANAGDLIVDEYDYQNYDYRINPGSLVMRRSKTFKRLTFRWDGKRESLISSEEIANTESSDVFLGYPKNPELYVPSR